MADENECSGGALCQTGILAAEEAAEGEGEAGVGEDHAAEGGEGGDELREAAEGFAGVQVARPGADLARGGEVGVAVALEQRAGEGIELQRGGRGARQSVGLAHGEAGGGRLGDVGPVREAECDGLPGGQLALHRGEQRVARDGLGGGNGCGSVHRAA